MSLLQRIRTSLDRDKGLSWTSKIAKGVRYGAALLTAPLYLRDIDRVGRRARTRGRPVVENLGRIEIGDDFQVNCAYTPVVLRSGRGSEIIVGDRVDMNFGVRVSARERVRIGHRVGLGPYVTIADHDDRGTAPIVIGDDVWLAARVTVERGVTIGAGTVVTAGSVVRGSLPSGVIAGGSPARALGPRPGFVPTADIGEANAVATKVPANTVEQEPEHRLLLVADFTIQELASHLKASHPLGPRLDAVSAPFDQVVQSLMQLDPIAREHAADTAIVWTRPERAVSAFGEKLRGEPVSLESIHAEVDAFADLLAAAAKSVRFVLVPSWVLPAHHRGLGMIDMKAGGVASTLMQMNLRLAERLEAIPNVCILDASRWITEAGARGYSAKLWYMGKVGWSPAVFAAAAEDVRAALRGFAGAARKLVVLDLDDTLWGGVVGDVGWQSLRLGGHDPLGEAFVDFQREVRALARRGVALAVVSKNEEATALEAMESHPEMLLRRADLATWRINWRDKAGNIAEIAKEMNLGLQSVVFIDDNPVERARVREALPEVYVPEWPLDKTQYATALLGLRCFDTPRISREDLERTRLYAEERQRTELRSQVGSLDEWLSTLGTTVKLARLDASNLPRTTQLFNKTNQMNVRTRRLTEAELLAWASAPNREVWSAFVSDRLGDAGLTGVIGLEVAGGDATLVDYILSCRVMGRRVEQALVWFAWERARARGAKRLMVPFMPTAKNKPCRTFWDASGLAHEMDGDLYVLEAGYAKPDGVEVHW
jgi:FkbH-like protein